MTNDELLDVWANADGVVKRWVEKRDRIELKLRQRMEAEGATAIAHPTLTCELKAPTPTYDYGKLHGLAELVPPDVLATGYTPPHEETVTVPERWDARVFKTWAKYGAGVARVINDAAIPGTPRLVIKSKA